MPDTLYLIDYAEQVGSFNMGLDAALLAAPPDQPVLRLYGWKPSTISLGRFQTLSADESQALKSFVITRRTSGGGAIFHWGELTYSICGSFNSLRLAGDAGAAYARFHRAWIAALTEFAGLKRDTLFMPAMRGQTDRNEGVDRLWCFSRRTGYDVLAQTTGKQVEQEPRGELAIFQTAARRFLPTGTPPERKLIGSAQRHRAGVLLQHGSIKLRTSPLGPWEAGLEELTGESISVERSAPDLARLFASHLGYKLSAFAPSQQHLDEAHRQAETRFGNPDWVERSRR